MQCYSIFAEWAVYQIAIVKFQSGHPHCCGRLLKLMKANNAALEARIARLEAQMGNNPNASVDTFDGIDPNDVSNFSDNAAG